LAIRTKPLALDYVLTNRGHRYLGTEEEKVTFLTEELGIDRTKLPGTMYSVSPIRARF
jgi:hypothetical protein